MPNNSQVKFKKTEVEDHHSISNKTTFVTACNDSLKSRTSNVNVVCATCGKLPISIRQPKSQANKYVGTHPKKTVASDSTIYMRKLIVQLILFIVDSGCTKHMTGNLKLLCNFLKKYTGTVRFGNNQFAPILGYGDLVQGNITINMVYYIEGLNHNLFSGNDLLTGNRGSDLYKISLQETTSSTPICFMAKALPTQAWLWHRRLSYLNFNYINLLLKKDIVIGLPKLKYVKDQLCSSCEALDYDNSGLAPQLQNVSPSADTTALSQQELDLLFGPLYDEFFTACTSSVNKSSSPIDNSKQQETPPTTNVQSSSEPTTPTKTVYAEKNNDNQAIYT
nr:hypothetical protein [Tanacetum cinerariifolium]